MKSLYAALLVGGSVLGTSGVVLAHHSFAMFDQEHPMQLVGTVKEYRYTSPHTFIILDVKTRGRHQPAVESRGWRAERPHPRRLVEQDPEAG